MSLARQIRWVNVILLLLACCHNAVALSNTDPDNFSVKFPNAKYLAQIGRSGGAGFVTARFKFQYDNVQNVARQFLRVADTGLVVLPNDPRPVPSSARMEVFQGVVPEGSEDADVRGVTYGATDGLFAVPFICVGRTFGGAVAASGGGTWGHQQLIRRVEYKLNREGLVWGCYPRPTSGPPTPGPWIDGQSKGGFSEVFGLTRPGSNIVLMDCPTSKEINVGWQLGFNTFGDEIDLRATDTLQYSTRFESYFYVDCDFPQDGFPETLFFRVDWGWQVTYSTIADAATDSMGRIERYPVRITTGPPPIPPEDYRNGEIQGVKDDQWIVTEVR